MMVFLEVICMIQDLLQVTEIKQSDQYCPNLNQIHGFSLEG